MSELVDVGHATVVAHGLVEFLASIWDNDFATGESRLAMVAEVMRKGVQGSLAQLDNYDLTPKEKDVALAKLRKFLAVAKALEAK